MGSGLAYPDQWGAEGLLSEMLIAYFDSWEEFGLIRQEDHLRLEAGELEGNMAQLEGVPSLASEGRLSVGMPAAAKDEKGRWRRMKVMAIEEGRTGGTTKVRLACVDIYKELSMKAELVKPLPVELITFPPALFHCRLSNEQSNSGPSELPSPTRIAGIKRPELFLVSAIPVMDDPGSDLRLTTVLLQFPVDFERALRNASRPRGGPDEAIFSAEVVDQRSLNFYAPKILKLQGKLNSPTWIDYVPMRVTEITATSGRLVLVGEHTREYELALKKMGTTEASLTAAVTQLHGGSLGVNDLSRVLRPGDVLSVKCHRYVVTSEEGGEDHSTMSAWEARDMRSRNCNPRHPVHTHAVLQDFIPAKDGRKVAKLVSRVFEGLVIAATAESFGLDPAADLSQYIGKYRTVVVRASMVPSAGDWAASAVGSQWRAESAELLEPLEEDIGYMYLVASSYVIIYRDGIESLPCRYIYAPVGLVEARGLSQSEWAGVAVEFAACQDQPGTNEAAKAAAGKWKAISAVLLPHEAKKKPLFPGIWTPTGGDHPVTARAMAYSRSAAAAISRNSLNTSMDEEALREWDSQTPAQQPNAPKPLIPAKAAAASVATPSSTPQPLFPPSAGAHKDGFIPTGPAAASSQQQMDTSVFPSSTASTRLNTPVPSAKGSTKDLFAAPSPTPEDEAVNQSLNGRHGLRVVDLLEDFRLDEPLVPVSGPPPTPVPTASASPPLPLNPSPTPINPDLIDLQF